MVIHTRVGGLGAAAWVLVILGPPGWLALLLLFALGTGREQLVVRIPYGDRALDAERPWRRLRWASSVVCLAAVALAVLRAPHSVLPWLALALVALIALFVACTVLYFRSVDVSLDGSRRWVTLSNVHPSFADAVAAATNASGRLMNDAPRV